MSILNTDFINQEIKFLVSVFKENGYKEDLLRNTINEVKGEVHTENYFFFY